MNAPHPSIYAPLRVPSSYAKKNFKRQKKKKYLTKNILEI